jgi:NADH-ubiquinone oxidoreductase chain 5
MILNFILLIGTLTITIAGLRALFEFDLKKIIALSTLRQLGLIIFILGLNYPILAFFHLITHATFKALLFISAGLIIHISLNNQDIRTIGQITKQIPIISSTINTANLALCGLPFLAGFYSKDLIIEISFSSNFNIIIFLIRLLAISLTCFYSIRLSYLAIISTQNTNPINNISSRSITRPIILISILAITSGRTLQ